MLKWREGGLAKGSARGTLTNLYSLTCLVKSLRVSSTNIDKIHFIFGTVAEVG